MKEIVSLAMMLSVEHAWNKLKIKGNLKIEANKNNLKRQVLEIQRAAKYSDKVGFGSSRVSTEFQLSPLLSPATSARLYATKVFSCAGWSLGVPGTCLLSLEIPQRKDFFSHPFFERSLKEESQRLLDAHTWTTTCCDSSLGPERRQDVIIWQFSKKSLLVLQDERERTWIMKTVSASVKSTVPTPCPVSYDHIGSWPSRQFFLQ